MTYKQFAEENNVSKKFNNSIGRVTNVDLVKNTCTLSIENRATDKVPIETVVRNIVYDGLGAITNPSILKRWSGFDKEKSRRR